MVLSNFGYAYAKYLRQAQAIDTGIISMVCFRSSQRTRLPFPEKSRVYDAKYYMTLWFYILSILLLIGFELNAAIDFAHRHKRRFRVSQKSA